MLINEPRVGWPRCWRCCLGPDCSRCAGQGHVRVLNHVLSSEQSRQSDVWMRCSDMPPSSEHRRGFWGEAELKRVLWKNAIWKAEAGGWWDFSDSFLGFEYIPLTIWQLSDVMMVFKGEYCGIVKMDLIQQIVSANFCDIDKMPKSLAAFSKSLNFSGQPEGAEHFVRCVLSWCSQSFHPKMDLDPNTLWGSGLGPSLNSVTCSLLLASGHQTGWRHRPSRYFSVLG